MNEMPPPDSFELTLKVGREAAEGRNRCLFQPRWVLNPFLHLNPVPDSGVLTSMFWKTSSTLRKEPSRPSHSWDLQGQPASLPLLSLHRLFLLRVFKASGLGQKPEGGMVHRPAPGLKVLPV